MKGTLFVLGAAALLIGVAFAQSNASGNAENGKRLFLRDGCWECHGYAGQGGTAGARIGATSLSMQGFMRYVRQPAATMPAFTEKVVNDSDLTDIYAYLKSLPPVKPAKDIPLLNQMKNQ
ncbi:MAG: c-type cytochrome [Acidobacteriia bacterium]|nr:c-type cytochrome [Terriglobia bacterium]